MGPGARAGPAAHAGRVDAGGRGTALLVGGASGHGGPRGAHLRVRWDQQREVPRGRPAPVRPVDLGEGREVLCDVAPADSKYVTFRKDNELVAVIEHRPFLDDLYVNEKLKQAREKREKIIGNKNDVEVILPILYIVNDSLFQQQSALDRTLRNEFGYGLSYTNFEYSKLKLSSSTFKDKITWNRN